MTLRQRRPLDFFELHEWLDTDFQTITNSYSKICAIGSQEAIDIASELVNLCGKLMEAAMASDPAQSYVTRQVKGERQTAEQVQAHEAVRVLLFKEREIFANLIRHETGRKTGSASDPASGVGGS